MRALLDSQIRKARARAEIIPIPTTWEEVFISIPTEWEVKIIPVVVTPPAKPGPGR